MKYNKDVWEFLILDGWGWVVGERATCTAAARIAAENTITPALCRIV